VERLRVPAEGGIDSRGRMDFISFLKSRRGARSSGAFSNRREVGEKKACRVIGHPGPANQELRKEKREK